MSHESEVCAEERKERYRNDKNFARYESVIYDKCGAKREGMSRESKGISAIYYTKQYECSTRLGLRLTPHVRIKKAEFRWVGNLSSSDRMCGMLSSVSYMFIK